MSRYSSSYSGSYERPEQTVNTIMDNLSKGGVQPDYASQWAQYYRSQGMSREAEMIETYVRGKERGERERYSSSSHDRGAPSHSGGYGTSECYRCNKIGHFARECPEYTGKPREFERRRRSSERDRRDIGPRGLPPSRDGDRYGSSGSVCYRCNGVGHFARECPDYTGRGRPDDRSRDGGGPMRRVAHPSRDQPPGTSECYRCNKIGHFARECPQYTGVPYPNARRVLGGTSYPGRGRGSGDYGTSKCLKCNRYGHFARECREEENRCYKCHESGHIAKDCSKEDVCYVCNKEGHLAKDCPDGDKKTCYRCNGKGHIALDCPSSQRALDRVAPRKKDDIDLAAGDQVLSAADLEDL